MKPHKTAGWLNPQCTAAELAAGSKRICQVYLEAPDKWKKEGVKTICMDEKTGIQALERIAPDHPMRVGQVRKQEFEYRRHGTQCLLANWDVVHGQVIRPSIRERRTEQDLYEHIQQTTASDPGVKKWCVVLDQLNTHQSEALVRWIATRIGLDPAVLGKKGRSGILKNMTSRAHFLTNSDHPVYFVYTPKHCSWLNQIELWFGILGRRLLRRGNFTSKQDLKEQLLRFIDYFNRALAKPFKWTYNGKPLVST